MMYKDNSIINIFTRLILINNVFINQLIFKRIIMFLGKLNSTKLDKQ